MISKMKEEEESRGTGGWEVEKAEKLRKEREDRGWEMEKKEEV